MHSSSDPTPPELYAAFREVQRPRLIAFAFVFMLGDRTGAEHAADAALAATTGSVNQLRHPERAAAWLRRHIVRSPQVRPTPSAAGQAAMARIGIDAARFAALCALDRLERAALVASVVEGIDSRDVEDIVGCRPRDLDRLLKRATRKYLAAHKRSHSGLPPAHPRALATRPVHS